MSSRRARQGGLSLVEVVVFIVVLAVGFVGILVLFNQVTRASVDPLVRKQALALASSLLEEIQLRPFTLCDPDDPAVYSAAVAGDCATLEAIGIEGGEGRYAEPRFDNVSDYDGFGMAGATVRTANGDVVAGLGDYSVQVQVATIAGAAEIPGMLANDDALRITVTAVHVPTATQVILQGYRLRYAPNSP